MILGLDRPDSGKALVNGVPFASLTRPLRHVGALLDATAVPAGRSGRRHLEALARYNGIGQARAAEVLAEVGLTEGATVGRQDDELVVAGLPPSRIGDLALERGIALRELHAVSATLEDAFVAFTAGSVEYRAQPPAAASLGA